MQTWQLQEAKAQLSELVRLCSSDGPQILTIRGKEEAVLISKKQYEKLTAKKLSFTKFMRNSPLKGIKLKLSRNKSFDRDIDL